MNKFLVLSTCMFAASGSVDASPPPEQWLVGVWQLSSSDKGRFSPECSSITLQFTADGHLIRKTGRLEYTTKVKAVPTESRYRLEETLTASNDERSCTGKDAEVVLRHLNKSAYVRPERDRLLYFRGESADDKIIFNRNGT